MHGLLLAVGLWSVYAFTMSTPGMLDRNGLVKGTDFLYFYTLGKLAPTNGDLLYDMNAQAVLIAHSVPEAAGNAYVSLYGPQVSLFFAPFAQLSYGNALVAWLLLNVLIYVFCCYAVWRTCPNLRTERWTVLVLAIGFPGFFHLLAWGQTSGLALLFFTLAYLALRAQRPWLAGLAIGCLIFKPQLGLAAAIVFILCRQWKIVLGAIFSASLQLAIGWMHYGTSVMRDYGRAVWHVSDVMRLLEPRPYQMHSLWSFWSLLLPWSKAAFVLYIMSAVVILIVAIRAWQSNLPLGVRYSVLLFATTLVSPHLTVYDLVILAPAFLFLSDWILEQNSGNFISYILYFCYPLFLIGPVARFTHLQLSVIAMVILLWTIWKAVQNTPTHFPSPSVAATLKTP